LVIICQSTSVASPSSRIALVYVSFFFL
jgi:hypothetical protein